MSGDVDPSAIQGEITSTVPLTQLPKEHGQANFGSAGDPYAFTSDGLVVLFNNEWTLFVADDLTLDDVVRLSKRVTSWAGRISHSIKARTLAPGCIYCYMTLTTAIRWP